MNARCTLVLAAAFLLPAAALSQYQWIDKDGRKVFSDRPPPTEVPADKILKQPGRSALPEAAPASVAASAAASAPKLAGKDKALEEKKKQLEAAEAAKKKVEEQKVAELREDNCQRARQSKGAFDTGARMQRTNERGERIVLDDKERASEVAKLEDIIARDCKK